MVAQIPAALAQEDQRVAGDVGHAGREQAEGLVDRAVGVIEFHAQAEAPAELMEILQADQGPDVAVEGVASADGGEADLADRDGEPELQGQDVRAGPEARSLLRRAGGWRGKSSGGRAAAGAVEGIPDGEMSMPGDALARDEHGPVGGVDLDALGAGADDFALDGWSRP